MYKQIVALVVLALLSGTTAAHKLAPSLLRLDQSGPGEFAVTWKTPATSQAQRSLKPVFPGHCRNADRPLAEPEGTGIVWRWTLQCDQALTGETLAVEGLAETATATLVRIQWQNGEQVQQLLNADDKSFVIPPQQGPMQVLANYLVLGVEHIWLGIDHLLFVLALVLLVPGTRRLIWTITAFTVGHSITLSLVVLGFLDFPISLVEFAIAASILILAVELSASRRSSDQQVGRGWLGRHSWLIAVGFGLLHGMGFAAALSEVGLPANEIPLALLSFNVGIELGQVLFVLAALAVMTLARRYLASVTRPAWWATVYSIGGLSAFWCLERGLPQWIV